MLVSDDTAKLNDCLHIVDRALNFVVNEGELRLWQHHVVHTVHGTGDEMAQVLVHKLTQEGGEWCHYASHRVEHTEQGRQSFLAIGLTTVTLRYVNLVLESLHLTVSHLQPLPVHPNVPVGKVFNELYEPWHHSIQSICSHFMFHKLHQCLRERQDPPVHDVVQRGQRCFVVFEGR